MRQIWIPPKCCFGISNADLEEAYITFEQQNQILILTKKRHL
jgi:hypothetical protein